MSRCAMCEQAWWGAIAGVLADEKALAGCAVFIVGDHEVVRLPWRRALGVRDLQQRTQYCRCGWHCAARLASK